MRKVWEDLIGWAKKRDPNAILGYSSIPEPKARLALERSYQTQSFQPFLQESNQLGLPSLCRAIREWYGAKDKEVLLAPGATSAMYIVLKAFLRPGSEIIIESPFYEPLGLVPASFGANIVPWERKRPNWKLDIEELPALINKNTSCILITNPHNPTSTFTTKPELEHIGRIAQEHGIPVLVDEIYLDILRDFDTEKISYGGGQTCSVASLSSSFLSINSFSKVIGLPRLRIGWILADSTVMKELRYYHKMIINLGSHDMEAMAAALFQDMETFIHSAQSMVIQNRKILDEALAPFKKSGLLQGNIPEKACTYLARLPFLEDLPPKQADGILEELAATCGLVPGGFFGESLNDTVRIGLGGESEAYKQEVKKLVTFFENLQL